MQSGEELAAMYDEVLKISAVSQYRDNPQGYPTGFFQVLAPDGRQLGYGFFCPRCKVSAFGLDENSVVKHCGNQPIRFPTGLVGWLKTLGLPTYTLSPRPWF